MMARQSGVAEARGQFRVFARVATQECRLQLRSWVPYLALGLPLVYMFGEARGSGMGLPEYGYRCGYYCNFLISLVFLVSVLHAARRDRVARSAELVAARPVSASAYLVGRMAALVAVQAAVALGVFVLGLAIVRPQWLPDSRGLEAGAGAALAGNLGIATWNLFFVALPGVMLATALVTLVTHLSGSDLPPLLVGIAVWAQGALGAGPRWAQYLSPLFVPRRYSALLGLGSAGAVAVANRVFVLAAAGLIVLLAVALVPRRWPLLAPSGRRRRLGLVLGAVFALLAVSAGSVLAASPSEARLVAWDIERCQEAAGIQGGEPLSPPVSAWGMRLVGGLAAAPGWVKTRVQPDFGAGVIEVWAAGVHLDEVAAYAEEVWRVAAAMRDQFPDLARGLRVVEIPGVSRAAEAVVAVPGPPPPDGSCRAAIALLCRSWWQAAICGPGGEAPEVMPEGYTALPLLEEWVLCERFLGAPAVEQEVAAWRVFAGPRTAGATAPVRAAQQELSRAGAILGRYSREELDWALEVWDWSSGVDRQAFLGALLGLAESSPGRLDLEAVCAALEAEFGSPLPRLTGGGG
ncbi:MAG: hypothetical protein K6T75_10295 [Acetobacteraceae bacterium]|nr:hypothetical protein [Acetobacteraceae bacterium]